ncbi:hypothetical protein EC34880_5495 [Escherichia coli 3.4880]|nr:hypothetical protein EC34880_5495 [Escherichia coli 3.4880]
MRPMPPFHNELAERLVAYRSLVVLIEIHHDGFRLLFNRWQVSGDQRHCQNHSPIHVKGCWSLHYSVHYPAPSMKQPILYLVVSLNLLNELVETNLTIQKQACALTLIADRMNELRLLQKHFSGDFLHITKCVKQLCHVVTNLHVLPPRHRIALQAQDHRPSEGRLPYA